MKTCNFYLPNAKRICIVRVYSNEGKYVIDRSGAFEIKEDLKKEIESRYPDARLINIGQECSEFIEVNVYLK